MTGGWFREWRGCIISISSMVIILAGAFVGVAYSSPSFHGTIVSQYAYEGDNAPFRILTIRLDNGQLLNQTVSCTFYQNNQSVIVAVSQPHYYWWPVKPIDYSSAYISSPVAGGCNGAR